MAKRNNGNGDGSGSGKPPPPPQPKKTEKVAVAAGVPNPEDKNFRQVLLDGKADAIVATIRAHALSPGPALDLQQALDLIGPVEQSKVYKALAAEISTNVEQQDGLRRNVRAALKSWDAMVICADLAAIPSGSRKNPVHERMRAIAKEPFYWDEKIVAVDLSLYLRTPVVASKEAAEHSGEDDARENKKSRKLSLQHCYAVRLPDDEEARAALIEENYGSTYRENLKRYMFENGSSIDLDGHVSRDPRYPDRHAIGTSRDDADPDASVLVAEVDPEFPVEISARAIASLGSDEEFIQKVVNESYNMHVLKTPLIHFMEGIDKNFADPSKREGITAHMFVVYAHPSHVQGDTELIRNIQLLLLRFCAYYMDNDARQKEEQANTEKAHANKIARAAQRSREELRKRAEAVQQSIKHLGEMATEMEANMKENPDVARFINWMRDIRALFRTGDPISLLNVNAEVRGNHNSWTTEQLAAALWMYNRPELPDYLRGTASAGRSLPDLWDAISVSTSDDEYQSRTDRLIVHRHGIFNIMRHMKPDDVTAVFRVMKQWSNTYAELFHETSDQCSFYLSQILFLLGRPQFRLELEDPEARKPFTFVDQSMLEGLLAFANIIDKGLADDKLEHDEAAKLTGGIRKCEVSISKPVSDDDTDEHRKKVERKFAEKLGPSHLIVHIQQNEILSRRDGKTATDNLKKLVALVKEKSFQTQLDAQPESVSAAEAKQRATSTFNQVWIRGGKQETSASLAKALGLARGFGLNSESFAFPQDAGKDLAIESSIEMPSGNSYSIAWLTCDPDNNSYELRFRRKVGGDEFSTLDKDD